MSAGESGNSFLPEAIVFNILTRLPVKSICRFKCVCKTWLSIISAQLFVDSHTARSKSQPKLLVTFYTNESRYLFIADLVPEQNNDGSSDLVVVLRQSVTIMPVKHCSYGRNVMPGDSQSVGGLMFSLCSQNLIRIANPSTNRCVAFSPRIFPSLPEDTHLDTYRGYVSLGFDPVEGKHKLLESLTMFHRDIIVEVQFTTYHRVVTLGDDTPLGWRYLKDGPSINRGVHGPPEICISGVIYFTAWVNWPSQEIYGWDGRYMVAFDVRTESFQVMKLPTKGTLHDSVYSRMYIEFEGKVAIVDCPNSNSWDYHYQFDLDGEDAVELWVLEDFQNYVWSLKFAVLPSMMMDSPFRPKGKLVGTTLDGELIFAVFVYNSNIYSTMIPVTVPFSFLFFDMKTGDFRTSQVRLPEGFALTGDLKITAMGHVEKLLFI